MYWLAGSYTERLASDGLPGDDYLGGVPLEDILQGGAYEVYSHSKKED